MNFEVQGHRGARGLRPENTLPGFVHAFEMGVDAVEFDVGLTADGVAVLSHDQTISPVTCRDLDPARPVVGRAIRDLTLADVKRADAGVRRQGDTDPYLFTQLPIPGTLIPTLAEVCALATSYDPVPVLAIELKTDPSWPADEVDDFVAEVARVVTAHGLRDHARLLGFDWRVITAAVRLAPSLGRVALVEAKTIVPETPWLAGFDGADWPAAALAAGATMISPEDTLVTPASLAACHAQALPVAVWTVNEEADLARFLSYGVDAIVTDYPNRLRAVMTAQGMPAPRPATVRALARRP